MCMGFCISEGDFEGEMLIISEFNILSMWLRKMPLLENNFLENIILVNNRISSKGGWGCIKIIIRFLILFKKSDCKNNFLSLL